MQIFVRNLIGLTLPVEVEPLGTIASLKTMVLHMEGFSTDQFTLIFAGKHLQEEDERTLSDLDIQQGSAIQMVRKRLKGRVSKVEKDIVDMKKDIIDMKKDIADIKNMLLAKANTLSSQSSRTSGWDEETGSADQAQRVSGRSSGASTSDDIPANLLAQWSFCNFSKCQLKEINETENKEITHLIGFKRNEDDLLESLNNLSIIGMGLRLWVWINALFLEKGRRGESNLDFLLLQETVLT